MTTQIGALSVDIGADTDGFENNIERARTAMAAVRESMASDLTRVEQGLSRTSRAADAFRAGVGGIGPAVNGAGIATLSSLATEASDRFTRMGAAVNSASGALAALGAGQYAGALSTLAGTLDVVAAGAAKVGSTSAASSISVGALAEGLSLLARIGLFSAGVVAGVVTQSSALGTGAQSAAQYAAGWATTMERLNQVLLTTEQRAEAAAAAMLTADKARQSLANEQALGQLFEQRSQAVERYNRVSREMDTIQARITEREARDAARGFDPSVTARRQAADQAQLETLRARRAELARTNQELNAQERTIMEAQRLSDARIYTTPTGPAVPPPSPAGGSAGRAAREAPQYGPGMNDFIESQRQTATEAQRVFEATRTAQERNAASLERYNELLGSGAIDQDTYNRAVAGLAPAADQAQVSFGKLGGAIATAFEDLIFNGKKAQDVVKALLLDISKLVLRQALTSAVNSGASAAGGSSLVTELLASFGGPRAAGGPISPSSWYMVGEKGPEVFAPGMSGSIIPNDALAGGGSASVTVNINSPDVDGFNQSRDQVAATVADGVQRGRRLR